MLRPRSLGLLLALATLLVYLPVINFDFINFDDPGYVTENRVVQNGLTWAGVKWAFEGAHLANWHPLTWLSHMVDCDLFRLNPAGHHLVNSLLHAVNAALLFTLLFRWTGRMWAAAVVAALFAWHPLHVESVAWVSERKDMLSTLFTLLTLLSYTRYVNRVAAGAPPGPGFTGAAARDYWLAWFWFALALLSKPMPVTLPVVMLLLDFWPLRRVGAEKWPVKRLVRLGLEKWPFFLLTVVFCAVTVLAQQQALRSLTTVPLGIRLENVALAYVGYLWKMVWPMQLGIFYPLTSPLDGAAVAGAVLVLTGLSVLAWRTRQSQPWLLVGWLWFVVTLLPVIGLVQVGAQAMADRYSYFPLIGIFIAMTYAAAALASAGPGLKRGLAVVASVLLVGCVVLTERQLRHWRNSDTLFTHTLTVADSFVAHFYLGGALVAQNRTAEALTHYLMVTKLNPEWALAYANIGQILFAEGKLEAAAGYYEQAMRWQADEPYPYYDYGVILAKLGREPEAMQAFAAAMKVDATYAPPHWGMGRLLLQQGREVEALPHLRRALQLAPDNLELLVFTISVLAAAENPSVRDGVEARRLAEKLVKLTAGQAGALDMLAMAEAELGQFDAAVQLQQQAIQLLAATGSPAEVALLQKRLQLYQLRQPWRQSFKTVANER